MDPKPATPIKEAPDKAVDERILTDDERAALVKEAAERETIGEELETLLPALARMSISAKAQGHSLLDVIDHAAKSGFGISVR